MAKLIDILKSRGKLGAACLCLLGLGHMFLVYLGKIAGTYEVGATIFFTGISLFGIRGALDPK